MLFVHILVVIVTDIKVLILCEKVQKENDAYLTRCLLKENE